MDWFVYGIFKKRTPVRLTNRGSCRTGVVALPPHLFLVDPEDVCRDFLDSGS